jgi:predicted DNA-binding protein (UPF0251 family)
MLPAEIAALHGIDCRAGGASAAEARASGAEAMVAYLKLLIAKMKRERFGQSVERGRKLLDQLELQLEELEASATEDAVAGGSAEPDCRRPIKMSPLCQLQMTLPRVYPEGVGVTVRLMSDGELTRLEVLRDLDQKRLTTETAARLLRLERRQVFRLLKAYRTEGATGLISKRRGRPSNRRKPEALRRAALQRSASRTGISGRPWRLRSCERSTG